MITKLNENFEIVRKKVHKLLVKQGPGSIPAEGGTSRLVASKKGSQLTVNVRDKQTFLHTYAQPDVHMVNATVPQHKIALNVGAYACTKKSLIVVVLVILFNDHHL